jgi:hypothetical protein
MKSVLVLMALMTASTAAFADPTGPTRQKDRCWAVTDSSRGFGYWDRCASREEVIKYSQDQNLTFFYDRAASQPDLPGPGDGGGAGGGGGGAN